MTRLPFYLDKAVTYFNKALRIYEKKLAPGHPLIKQAVECLLVAYELQKRFLEFHFNPYQIQEHSKLVHG